MVLVEVVLFAARREHVRPLVLVPNAGNTIADDRGVRDHCIPDGVPSALRIHLEPDALAKRMVLELDWVVSTQAARAGFVARLGIRMMESVGPDHRRLEL